MMCKSFLGRDHDHEEFGDDIRVTLLAKIKQENSYLKDLFAVLDSINHADYSYNLEQALLEAGYHVQNYTKTIDLVVNQGVFEEFDANIAEFLYDEHLVQFWRDFFGEAERICTLTEFAIQYSTYLSLLNRWDTCKIELDLMKEVLNTTLGKFTTLCCDV